MRIEAYVAFRDALRPGLVHRFTRPGFGHALAILPQGPAHCLKIEHCWWGLYPEAFSEPARKLADALVFHCGADVLHFESDADITRPWRPRALTCVSAVKAVLGVWWPTVWTPYGLYRRLLAEGAKPLEESRWERKPSDFSRSSGEPPPA